MTTRLEAATERLLATVDRLPDPEWGAASECEGWSLAHVVAHLALNAEALAGVLRGVAESRIVPMYVADEVRDSDIAALAAETPEVVRHRLQQAAAAFDDALAAAGVLPGDTTFERTPGGRTVPVAAVPGLRLREVEVHHADLRAGYGHEDWPAETVVDFLDADAGRHLGDPFTARATDLGQEWRFGTPGDGDPVVSGPASALAWWSTGRDPGSVLSSSTGTLPTMEGR